MAEVQNPSNKGDTTTSGAYGFGSAEPAREVPSRNGDAVKSSTEENSHKIFGILDEEFTDNIRGVAPVDGLELPLTVWEKTAIHPSWKDNCGENQGASTRSLGTWPIQGSALNPSLSHIAGKEDVDWTNEVPGEYGAGDELLDGGEPK